MSDQTIATPSARPTAPPPPVSPSSPSAASPAAGPAAPATAPAGPILPSLPSLPSLPPLGLPESDDSGPPTIPARPCDLPVPASAGPVSSGTVRAHRAGRRTARISHQPRPRPRPQAGARTPRRPGRGLTIGAALGLWVTSFVGGAVIGSLTRAVDLTPSPQVEHPAEASEQTPPTTHRPDGAVPAATDSGARPPTAAPATTVVAGNGNGHSGQGGGNGNGNARGQGNGNGSGNGHAHGRATEPAAPTTTTTVPPTTTTTAPTTTTTSPPGEGGNGNGNGDGGNGDGAAVTPLPIERPSTG